MPSGTTWGYFHPTKQDFWAFGVTIQMFYYYYGVDSAIALNAYEVIPPIMCNLGIS